MPVQSGVGCGAERSAHYSRTAALARSVALALALPETVFPCLDVAAEDHRVWPDCSAESHSDKAGPSRARTLPESEPPASPSDQTLASEIFSLCDEFDCAVEGAALYGAGVTVEAGDYLSTADECYRSDVVVGLKNLLETRKRNYRGGLPVMHSALSKLLQFRPESQDAANLATIAGMDQVLTARILAAANSALFGIRQPVTKLTGAISRLGIPVAHKILLQACVGAVFASSALRDLWRHSRLVATIASECAAECGIDPHLAYVTGLLHDIGRLELLRETRENQLAVQAWGDRGYPVAESESLTFGTNHAVRGGEMLQQWNLPQIISHAIALHHSPELASDCPLASLIFLAEVWAAERESIRHESMNVALRQQIARKQLGFSAGTIGLPESATPLIAWELAS